MSAQEITFDEVAAAAQGLVNNDLPVTVGAVNEALGGKSALSSLHTHLTAWRAAQATQLPEAAGLGADAAVPTSIAAALSGWAQQLAQDAAAPLRDSLAQTQSDLASLLQLSDQALTQLAERDVSIERLTVELRHARDIASNALVGKAKDQLAIEGKDAQIAELRRQLERQLASSAGESDARLAAEMELVGAVTARDNLAAEVAELRAQLDAGRAARGA